MAGSPLAGPRRAAAALIGPAVLLAVTAAFAAGFSDHYRAAVAAYRAGQPAEFLAAARAARERRPDSPQAAYLLAAAQASNGLADAAVSQLERLASQGLTFDPAAEPAFAPLRLADEQPALLARLAANADPFGAAGLTFELENDRFIPEGIARDEPRRRFLLGSIHQRRILAVPDAGDVAEFVPAGHGGLLSVFGMQAVPDTDSLWVATAGLRESGAIGAEEMGRTGILEFGLAGGGFRRAFWLPDDGRQHLLGELRVIGDARLLTSDSLSGEVLRLDTRTGAFEAVVPAGRLVSPQGLALAADGASAYVADYRGGLFRLDLADGTLTKLAEGGTTHHGTDGLYRHRDWLIAIQNGVRPHRVVALQLAETGDGVRAYRVLAAALDGFDEPTLGVLAGGRLHFVANSHWPRFDPDGRLPDGLSGPMVLSVALP